VRSWRPYPKKYREDAGVRGLLDAIDAFYDGLTGIAWAPFVLAVLCHVARLVARSRAWRNVVAAAYPDTEVRWLQVLGGYVAGVGANALLPGRGGDLLRLYIVKHRVEGSTYPTLASTMIADSVFDLVASTLLLGWAISIGIFPGSKVLPNLNTIDWLWVFKNPGRSIVIAGFFLAIGLIVLGLTYHRITAFWEHVRQGFAIFRTPRVYFAHVVPWEALDWLLRLTAIFFFLKAFELPETAYYTFVYQVAGSLSTALPLTPGGIGTEQALLVYLFSGVAASSKILAFSVGVKLTIITVNVALGTAAVVLMLGSVRWRQHVAAENIQTRG
jgi:uncharacterized protein (TIRG00374 family)